MIKPSGGVFGALMHFSRVELIFEAGGGERKVTLRKCSSGFERLNWKRKESLLHG